MVNLGNVFQRSIGFGNDLHTDGQRWQFCHEHELTGCEPSDLVCSKIDIAFVLGPGNDSDLGQWSIALSDLQRFADHLDANYVDYRIAVIGVEHLGTITVHETFSLNNAASAKSAIAAMSDIANWTEATDINGGLETAVTGGAGAWRSGSDIQRQIILISDSNAGGDNDTYSAADETDLESQAATGLAATDSITTHTMRTSWSDDGTPTAEPAWGELGRVLSETATAGGGTYQTFSDGAGYSLLYHLLRIVLDDLCYGGEYDSGNEHLACCKRGVCKLCLLFECYGQPDIEGNATQDLDTGIYSGSFGGHTFRAYWAVRGECVLIVEVDGIVVASFPKCPDSYEVGTSCRNPAGEFAWTEPAADEYDEPCAGTVTFGPYKPKRLQRRLGTPSCDADVAIVVDTNYRNAAGIEDLQGGVLQPLVDHLAANFSTYQLALIDFSVDNTYTTRVVNFSINNGAAFLTGVDTLTNDGGDTVLVDEHRRSDDGLADAVNGLTWRNGAIRKIVLLNQGYPSPSTPFVPANAFYLAQLNLAATFNSTPQFTLDTISIPFVFAAGPSISFNHAPEVENVNAETSAGRGTHVSVEAVNGSADYNDGVNELAPALISLIESMGCNGTCAKHFCGSCDCAPEAFCVTGTRELYDVTESGVGDLLWTGSGDCEFGASLARYQGDFEVGDDVIEIDLSLVAAISYEGAEECRLEGTVGGEAVSVVVVGCQDMTATITVTIDDAEYTLNLSPKSCGDCGDVTVDCCANPLPLVLNADFSGVVPVGPNPDDCACAHQVYPLTWNGGGPIQGEFGGWTSGLMGWPCPNQLNWDEWEIDLVCLTGVWTMAINFYLDGEFKSSITMTNFTFSECDPFEHEFQQANIFQGLCKPGLSPHETIVTVTA